MPAVVDGFPRFLLLTKQGKIPAGCPILCIVTGELQLTVIFTNLSICEL